MNSPLLFITRVLAKHPFFEYLVKGFLLLLMPAPPVPTTYSINTCWQCSCLGQELLFMKTLFLHGAYAISGPTHRDKSLL